MSNAHRPSAAIGISILFMLGGFLWAQPADPLEQTRLELNLKAQKLLRDISSKFSEAQAITRTNPEKARDILKGVKSMLEDDNLSLPERQRLELLRQVDAKLYDVNGRALAQKKADDKAAKDAADRIALEKRLAAADARAQNSVITPSVVIDYKFKVIKYQQDMMLAYMDRMRQAYSGTTDRYYGQTDKAAPKYKEIEIMKMLNSTMTMRVEAKPLKSCLEYIDDKTQNKLNILIDDSKVPEDALNKEMTVKMTKFSVRTILKRLLGENNLDYYIEDGTLRISDKETAVGKTVIKMYPIGKLVGANQGMMNPFMAQMMGQQTKSAAQSLAMLMMSTIEPDYWEMTGTGPGKVDWDPKSVSLIIKASVEMHYKLKASQILNNDRPPGTLPID